MSAAEPPKLERLSLKPGETIFVQGEPGYAAYIVERGRVTIYQHIDGQVVELATLKEGEIFGEMAVIDQGLRMASAIAGENTVVTRLPRANFEKKLAATDKFIRGLIHLFIKNIRGGHKTFLRRPRSFNDHLRLMKAFSHNLRRFSALSGDPATADRLTAKLDQLDQVLADLNALAAVCPDRRHDTVMSSQDMDGVDASAVLGSEAPTVSGAARPQR